MNNSSLQFGKLISSVRECEKRTASGIASPPFFVKEKEKGQGGDFCLFFFLYQLPHSGRFLREEFLAPATFLLPNERVDLIMQLTSVCRWIRGCKDPMKTGTGSKDVEPSKIVSARKLIGGQQCSLAVMKNG